MQWFNEPDQWSAEADAVRMSITPKTDYWRKTHYGFTVDDGPFYYANVGGEFEARVCLKGDYKARYDQMGLMVRRDEKTWIKTGIEFVDSRLNLSAVVTHDTSDWSVTALKDRPDFMWFKIRRQLDAVEISYSFDNNIYEMMRLAYFPKDCPVMVGLVAASPDGDGFEAVFEKFEIRHLPDQERLNWLESNR